MERGHPCPPEREARTAGEQRHDAAERAAHAGGQGCPRSISADLIAAPAISSVLRLCVLRFFVAKSKH
jgi:hypothetical protein